MCPGLNASLSLLDCPPGYFEILGAIAGFFGGGIAGGGTGAMLALPVGETIGPVTIPVGAIAGAIKGAAVGFAAGAALDGVVQMANAGRGRRGGNRVPNSQVKRLYKKYDLNNAGQDYVHDIISPEGMSIEEIEEVVKEAATHDKFPKNPPAPPE